MKHHLKAAEEISVYNTSIQYIKRYSKHGIDLYAKKTRKNYTNIYLYQREIEGYAKAIKHALIPHTSKDLLITYKDMEESG